MTGSPTLILLFNHTLTEVQKQDARKSLGVGDIVLPPPEIQRLWAQVPPEANSVNDTLTPVLSWLQQTAKPGDYVLIQGEFGATWRAVRHAFQLGLIPVYSTTRREAEEEHQGDGRVKVRHTFSHVRFRRYEHE